MERLTFDRREGISLSILVKEFACVLYMIVVGKKDLDVFKVKKKRKSPDTSRITKYRLFIPKTVKCCMY